MKEIKKDPCDDGKDADQQSIHADRTGTRCPRDDTRRHEKQHNDYLVDHGDGFYTLFAITTGPWSYSYAALQKSGDCVISIPTADLIDTVVGIGTCSGADTDKFKKFGLTPVKGEHVGSPLIKECLANIECNVIDIVEKHNIVVLEGVAAYFDSSRKEKRTIHAVGDGTFVVDGRKLDRREMMRSKLPDGV